MIPSELIECVTWQDVSLLAMARVKINVSGNSTLMTQAHVATITRTVKDRSTVIDTATLVVATTVFNTMQTGTVWTKDGTGYNFADELANTLFPTGGKNYRVDYAILLSGGKKFHIVYKVKTKSIQE